MRPRARLLAALLALFALSASFAEQVWASACGPGMAAVPTSSSSRTNDAGTGHGGMPMPRGSHDGSHSPAPSEPDECPLLALAGGCTLLSLPAAADRPSEAVPVPEAQIAVRMDRAPDLLLPSSLFHPPQR